MGILRPPTTRSTALLLVLVINYASCLHFPAQFSSGSAASVRTNLCPSHLLWERWGDLLHTVLHPCRRHLCRLQRVSCSTTSSSTRWLPRMPCHWWRCPQPRKPGHCRLDVGRASGLGWSLQENQSGGQQLFNPGCSWHHLRV